MGWRSAFPLTSPSCLNVYQNLGHLVKGFFPDLPTESKPPGAASRCAVF